MATQPALTPPVTPPAGAGAPDHGGYRPDIDGLRAIAVLAVIGFHAFPGWVRGGFIGVDVFFVISGFLISTIILHGLAGDRFTLAGFYGRRIRRIFPALVTVLLACLAAGWFLLFPDEYRQLGKHVAGGAGFVANFVLWNEAGYFDEAAETKPLLHLWSLGIEEQFYIVYPLVLWLAWRRRWNLVAVVAAIGVAAFGLNLALTARDPVAAFYSPLARAWELMAGSLLAVLAATRAARSSAGPRWGPPATASVRSALGVTLLVAGLALTTPQRAFPGWWVALPVLGTALMISAGPGAWLNRRLLAHRALVGCGLVSYPLYLWHWPLLAFARIVEGDTPSREVRLLAVAAAFALAWLTYRAIERPFRFGAHARLKVQALVITMAVAASLGYVVFQRMGFPARPWAAAAARANAQFVGAHWAYGQNDICLRDHPFAEASSLEWWFCMKSSPGPPTLLLLGTSLANQSYPGITQHPLLRHHRVLSIGTCDAAIDTNPSTSGPCYGDRQKRQRAFIDGIVAATPGLRFVLIDGLSRQPDTSYIAALKERIDFLEGHGAKVIILHPHPRLGFEPRACMPRPLKAAARDCSYSIEQRDRLARAFAPLRAAITASNPNVLFFDQTVIYCDVAPCSHVRDGMPLHRDRNHPSEYATRLVYERFVEWARVNVPEILREN